MDQAPCTQPKCSNCHSKDCFNFNVPNWLWAKVVPPEKQNGVVCLCCFDEMAKAQAVDYTNHLRKLYFAGQQANLEFEVVNAS